MKNVTVLLFIYLMRNSVSSACTILLKSHMFWSKENSSGNSNKLKTESSIWFCSAGRRQRGERFWRRVCRCRFARTNKNGPWRCRHTIWAFCCSDGWMELNSTWKRKFSLRFTVSVCLFVCLPGITEAYNCVPNVRYSYVGKAVPLQARRSPEGSRKLRFPDFVTTAQDGGKVVSLTHRPPLPPGNTPGTHFC